MALVVKLQEKVADGTWLAVGSFSNSSSQEGPATVLVQETKEGLKLVLDASLRLSKIMDKEVLHYTNAIPVLVPKVKVGTEVEFKKFWFNLKK